MRALPRRAAGGLSWALGAILLIPAAAAAQLVPGLPITVALRTSAALPQGDLGGANPGLSAGVGLGAGLVVHAEIASALSAYVAYDYERFTCDACTEPGRDTGMPAAGFELGLEWVPFGPGGVDPWVGAGVLLGRRLEIPDGGDGFSSEPGAGWSAGAGVRLPLGRSLRLLPAIRYRSHSARFAFPGLGFEQAGAAPLAQELSVTSIVLEVGLAYAL